MQQEGTRPGELALSFYQQLEPDTADEPLINQAVKCLIFLAKEMHAADAASGRLPAPTTNGTASSTVSGTIQPHHQHQQQRHNQQPEVAAGSADVVHQNGHATDSEDEGHQDAAQDGDQDADRLADLDDELAAEEQSGGGLSLMGLVRRMGKMADDRCVLSAALYAPPMFAFIASCHS